MKLRQLLNFLVMMLCAYLASLAWNAWLIASENLSAAQPWHQNIRAALTNAFDHLLPMFFLVFLAYGVYIMIWVWRIRAQIKSNS